jgi:hypothetical protein
MRTVAWYSIQSRTTAIDIAEALRSEELGRSSTRGYIVNHSDKDKIHAVFVSRSTKSISLTDIFGNEIKNETTDYVELEFELNVLDGFIEISSKRAGIRALLDSLSSISDFKVGFANIQVNVLAWSNLFLPKIGYNLSVDKILLNGLQYPRARGRLEITCEWQASEVEERVSALTSPEAFVERMRLRSAKAQDGFRSILLDRTGFCRISAAPSAVSAVTRAARSALLYARS